MMTLDAWSAWPYWVTWSAVRTESGTAITSAMTAITIVQYMIAPTPASWVVPSGFHWDMWNRKPEAVLLERGPRLDQQEQTDEQQDQQSSDPAGGDRDCRGTPGRRGGTDAAITRG